MIIHFFHSKSRRKAGLSPADSAVRGKTADFFDLFVYYILFSLGFQYKSAQGAPKREFFSQSRLRECARRRLPADIKRS
jgi:hypothetical protein